jgi:hypothetical protein
MASKRSWQEKGKTRKNETISRSPHFKLRKLEESTISSQTTSILL